MPSISQVDKKIFDSYVRYGHTDHMKLNAWMSKNNVKPEAAATELGVSVRTLYRYLSDERIPDKATMPRIVDYTSGQVTANDFYGINAEC